LIFAAFPLKATAIALLSVSVYWLEQGGQLSVKTLRKVRCYWF